MKRRFALAVAALLFAACDAFGAAAPSPTPSLHDRAVSAWHDAVQCARDHGWQVPDPVIDDQGNATFAQDVGKPPQDVLDACQHFLDALPNQQPANANAPTADDIRLGRQFAQCMRENGEPQWPDPNADGTFPATPEIEAQGKSAAFIAAVQSCERFHPSGRIYITQPAQ